MMIRTCFLYGEQVRIFVVRDDIYQVLSYMLALECRHSGAIFPDQQQGHQDIRFSMTGERKFWRIPVQIPTAETYSEFVSKMKKMEDLKKTNIGCVIWSNPDVR